MIAVFFLVLGMILMAVQWRAAPGFFRRRAEVAPDGFLEGEAAPGRGGIGRERRREALRWRRSSSATTARARQGGARARGRAGAGAGGPSSSVFGYAPPGVWGGEIAEHEEAIEELGERVMARRAARSRPAASGEAMLVAKRAPEALLEVAEARDARLIVVGSGGEAPLKGSSSARPRTSCCTGERPVLVVPQ